MNRTRLLLGAAVACTALSFVPDASADPPGAVGWWTQRPGAAPLENGGLEVASSLRGDESVAAVRVDALPGGATPSQLVLTEAAAPTGDAKLRACRASTPWEPADGGDFASRPQADCTTAVDAVAAGDGTWTIDLRLLLDGDTADVVLLPATTELVPGLPGIGFTITFSEVDVVAAPVAATPTTRVAPATPATTEVAAPAPATPAPVRPSPVPAGVPTTVVGVLNDGSGGSLAAPATPDAAVPGIMFDLASNDEQRPWGRLLVLVPLSIAAGYAAPAVRRRVAV